MMARGVEFTAPVADHGYGFVTYFTAPGGVTVQLYEPKYTKGTSRKKPAKKKPAKKKPAKKKPAKKKPAKKKPAKKKPAKKGRK
jgi:hypothetical protein